MGGWRWINAALVLVAFLMSVVWGIMLVGWTDHGRRKLNDIDIHFDTYGVLRAGQTSPAKIWIEEPINLELQITNGEIIPIAKSRFDKNNEYKFEIELPMNLENSTTIQVSANKKTTFANWDIGRLFR